MKFPMPTFKRSPKAPEVLEQEISEKAARRAARISAKGKARTRLDEAREGAPARRSLSVLIVHWSGYAALIAAGVIILAGYWYDLLFYGQQHDNILIVIGLLAFALVVRTVATSGDVILHWSKPENRRAEDPDNGLKALIGDNNAVRFSLRVMWIGSIIACAFATLSFFSAGHEARQNQQTDITATETGITTSKKERIEALEKQKTEAVEARDSAILSADKTIQSVKDEAPTVSAADNETIQTANGSKDAANAAYAATVAGLNGQINAINAEKETELKEVTVERAAAVPFLSVYKFLSRAVGTPDGWQIAGALFFSALFELLCAKLLSTVFALLKVLKRIARSIEMRDAADEMQARISLERMRSNIEIDAIRLKAAQAQERATADIDLALRERMIEKARAQAEALRAGVVWVDPDDLLNVQTALARAETEAKIRKIEERAAKIASGEIDPDAPERSPASQRGRDGGHASDHSKKTKTLDKRIPVRDWRAEEALKDAAE